MSKDERLKLGEKKVKNKLQHHVSIYGLEWRSLPTTSLNAPRVGKHTTTLGEHSTGQLSGVKGKNVVVC